MIQDDLISRYLIVSAKTLFPNKLSFAGTRVRLGPTTQPTSQPKARDELTQLPILFLLPPPRAREGPHGSGSAVHGRRL